MSRCQATAVIPELFTFSGSPYRGNAKMTGRPLRPAELFLVLDLERRNFAFTASGFYSFRSGWEPNAIWMGLHCGPDSIEPGGFHSQFDRGDCSDQFMI